MKTPHEILAAEIGAIHRRSLSEWQQIQSERLLFAFEEDVLRTHAGQPTTKAALARELGITRQALNWHGKRDGAPAGLDPAEWRAFLADKKPSPIRPDWRIIAELAPDLWFETWRDNLPLLLRAFGMRPAEAAIVGEKLRAELQLSLEQWKRETVFESWLTAQLKDV
jgi:hypothetical protein